MEQAFPVGVAGYLQWYVYRLIDPRNGETFYVGKGRDDRVFQHAKAALTATSEEDATDLKIQRIKDIDRAGLAVIHVIHRHGIKDDKIAYQIEAAVIDAYPGLSNQVGGHGSNELGVRHVTEIIAYYAAQEFEPRHPLILISIGKSYDDQLQDIYQAVHGFWKINLKRANGYNLILAHHKGLVLGAFRPVGEWLPADHVHFAELTDTLSGRFGFNGKRAEPEIESLYVRKRVPDRYRRPGAANPVRFIDLASTI